MKRTVGVLAVGAAALFAVVILSARPAAAEPAANEAQFLVLLNQLRAERGARPLISEGQLQSVARQWSANMASQQNLYHNPNLPSQITNWRLLGENVGVGASAPQLHQAFVNSPHHYENMIEPAFDHVGIGVVEDRGQIWVTVAFKQAKTLSAPAPPPAPTAAPKPAPKPVAAAPAPRPASKPAAAKPGSPSKPAAPAPAPPTTAAPAPTTVAPDPVASAEPEVAGKAFNRAKAAPASSSRPLGAATVAVGVVAAALLLVVVRRLVRLRAN